MKRILIGCLSLLLVLFCQGQSLQVMSYNIRLDVASDSPNHWQARKEKLVSVIRFQEADLVGVQEALPNQVADMKSLMPGYGFTGVGREDGKNKGEFSGIFFKTARLELMESRTFWLSLTPEVAGSKSWDAAITRIVSWAKFRDKFTRKVFYHFNTHFDHMGKEARRQSAHMLLQKVQEIAGSIPAVITGDFNADPTDEPIAVITNTADPLHLTNAETLSVSGHYGPTGTFNGFQSKEVNASPIDYIFLKGKWKVLQHATLSQTWEGRFASDHFAVFAKIEL
ncbi:MAG TPA: endonuclease/exonuclease/phosphatase family protein [Phnomibacter sp.]|nr:endonuclease/exonuclease/phosphatase family protein [Phnomibacter sp.]